MGGGGGGGGGPWRGVFFNSSLLLLQVGIISKLKEYDAFIGEHQLE